MNDRLRWLKRFSKSCALFYTGLYLLIVAHEEAPNR